MIISTRDCKCSVCEASTRIAIESGSDVPRNILCHRCNYRNTIKEKGNNFRKFRGYKAYKK